MFAFVFNVQDMINPLSIIGCFLEMILLDMQEKRRTKLVQIKNQNVKIKSNYSYTPNPAGGTHANTVIINNIVQSLKQILISSSSIPNTTQSLAFLVRIFMDYGLKQSSIQLVDQNPSFLDRFLFLMLLKSRVSNTTKIGINSQSCYLPH